MKVDNKDANSNGIGNYKVEKDFVYADIAGLSDTNGILIEFINIFILKYIF